MESTERDTQEAKLVPVAPIPPDAPKPKPHPKYGLPTKAYFEHDDAGRRTRVICEFERPEGNLTLALTYCETADGRRGWHWTRLAKEQIGARNPQSTEPVPCAPAARNPAVDLYAKVVAIFDERSTERLSSDAVCAALLKRHGMRISKNSLARQLRSCGIQSC